MSNPRHWDSMRDTLREAKGQLDRLRKERPRVVAAERICSRPVALKMFREAYLPKRPEGTTPAELWGLFLDRMVDEGIISRRQARKWAPPSEAR